MSIDTNLQFIREKISHIRSAIMYSMSNELISFPNSIVNAIKVDEEGQLWFVCDKPAYSVEQCPASFPVRLHFYRKGILCHVEISGRAEIVNNQYRGTEESIKPLLIKMSMQHIVYTEPHTKTRNSFEKWLERAGQWILRHMTVNREHKSALPTFQHR